MSYTPTTALRHLRALATTAVPNCVNLGTIDRVLSQTTFTEASTQEALLILDDVASTPGASDALLLSAIDAACQKLRPEPTPVHDAQALTQLEAAPMVAVGIPSTGPATCSPLSCDGCAACYKAGEPRPTTPTELPMLEGHQHFASTCQLCGTHIAGDKWLCADCLQDDPDSDEQEQLGLCSCGEILDPGEYCPVCDPIYLR